MRRFEAVVLPVGVKAALSPTSNRRLHPLRVIIASPDTKKRLTRYTKRLLRRPRTSVTQLYSSLPTSEVTLNGYYGLSSSTVLRGLCLNASSSVRAKLSCDFVSAEGPLSCLGGDASREAEAGGSLAAQTCLQSARRAACFKSRQRLPPRPVFVVKKTRPVSAP